MIKATRTLQHRRVVNQIPNRKRELIGSQCDLTRLIYWMEHDRSLDAQPDKIVLLKSLLVNLEPRIDKGAHEKSMH